METVWKDKFYMSFRLCPFILTIHSFPDMRILDVNDAYERSTGFRRDEVVGRTMFETGLWTDHEAMTRASEKLKKDGKIYNLEVHFRNRAGQDCNGLASSELFDGPDGQRVLSIVEDCSQTEVVGPAGQVLSAASINTTLSSMLSLAFGHYPAASSLSTDDRVLVGSRQSCQMGL